MLAGLALSRCQDTASARRGAGRLVSKVLQCVHRAIQRGVPWDKQSGAFQRGPSSTTSLDGPLLAAAAIAVPKAVKNVILPRNGRETDEYRLR
jgi:hypothetical protein